jgi:ferredoxin-NADP reductase
MTAAPQKAKAGAVKIPAVVDAIIPVNELVTRFEFKREDGGNFPAFSGGSHTVVEMDDDGKRRLNPYSLMSDPEDTSKYAISVRRDDEGRGGSLYLHTKLKVGDKISLTYPVNLFALDLRARKHIFLAGGIGITPFMSMIKQLERSSATWELHYSSRSPALSSYGGELAEKHPNSVHQYFDDQKQLIDLANLLSRQPPGTHVYVCGPAGMIKWVLSTADEMGWPSGHVHSEEFKAPQPGQPFQVKLCKSDRIIEVGETESLLEAIEREGIDAPFSCRSGACGQCEAAVIELDGKIIHNDHWLEPEERDSGKKIMPCVSRFVGKTIAIDR